MTLAELQQELKQKEQQLELVDQLIAIEGNHNEIQEEDAALTRREPEEFLDACERILKSRGEPMHIGLLQAALLEDGVPIPGKGAEANIIARIQRSNGRIIRVERGTYGLPEFGIPEKRPTRIRRRARKR